MATKKKTVVKDDGIYVYLGPSIRGIVQTGSIFRGSKADVLAELSYGISLYPKIATLVIEASEVMAAKKKIRSGGNSLAMAYKVLKKNAD